MSPPSYGSRFGLNEPRPTSPQRSAAWRAPNLVLFALLGAHLAIGIVRIPSRVISRRLDDIAQHQELGAARFLTESAKLQGADELEWVLANTPANCVVLWRWPADGALEFAAALLAPRLLVDCRQVPAGSTRFADRDIAIGTTPSGEHGLITLQGTDTDGLRLTVVPH